MSLAGWAKAGLAQCRDVFARMVDDGPEPESDETEENKSPSEASNEDFNLNFFSQSENSVQPKGQLLADALGVSLTTPTSSAPPAVTSSTPANASSSSSSSSSEQRIGASDTVLLCHF